MQKIAINTSTSGKVRYEKLNGRNHLVTEMRPIVGDIVMNGGMYPDAEVAKSFMQLDQLPAPNRHPVINGKNASAFHPLAANKHNVGAFIRNPRKVKKEVFNELWIDETVANQTDEGKEIINRLETGSPIGVSTGLQLERTEVNDDGLDYNWIGTNYQFDHVAILLENNQAGGDQTLTLNDDDLQIVEITNAFSSNNVKDQISALLNEGLTNTRAWVIDLMIEDGDSGSVVYELNEKLFKRDFTVMDDKVTLGSEGMEVIKTVTFTELNGGDASTSTNAKESEMTDKATNDSATVKDGEVTIEQAMNLLQKKGFTVVNATDARNEEIKYFLDNKDTLTTLVENQKSEEAELRKQVLEANSELTEDEVNGMSVNVLRKVITPAMDHSLNGGHIGTVNSGEDTRDFTINYDEEAA